MSGPLDGLRVIDCSRGTAGPRATGLLADYGAEVVKVEPPGGDPLRERLKISYSVFDRGKKSVELDLTDDDDRNQLLTLLGSADLFVESWREGTAERLGLDYETLNERFPELVYCSITGWGPGSIGEGLPGYEPLVHAEIGAMSEQQPAREGPMARDGTGTDFPSYVALPFASIGTAYLAVLGSLAAVYRARETGHGRQIETSLLDGALAYMQITWAELGDPEEAADQDRVGAGRRMITGHFECQDGKHICLMTGAVGSFDNLIEELGLDDKIPLSDTGQGMGGELTDEQQEVIDTEVPEVFKTKPREEWLDRLRELDVAVVPTRPPPEVFDEPHIRHHDMVMEVEDPDLGRVEQVGKPVKFEETPTTEPDPRPEPGEHNNELLQGVSVDGGAVAAPDDPPSREPLLADINILDFGSYFAGPHASRLLGDLGADVIKVDEPPMGDHMRFLERPFFVAQARKKSIGLDLSEPEGREIGHELAEWADIVHHNLRPGAAAGLEMDYETLTDVTDELVYLYQPGWGSSGPNKDWPSFAPLPSAYAGATHEVAGKDNAPVVQVANDDPAQSLLSACAMLMGFLQQQETGNSQYVESAQISASMAHIAHIARKPDGTVLGAERVDGDQAGVNALNRVYPTEDSWICLSVATPEETAALAEVTGVDIPDDDRFGAEISPEADADLREQDETVTEALADYFADRSTKSVLSALRAAGVPATEPVVPSPRHDFLNDPGNYETDRVAECDHPNHDRIRAIDRLIRISDEDRVPLARGPENSEHKEEILSMLGYEPDEIDALDEQDILM